MKREPERIHQLYQRLKGAPTVRFPRPRGELAAPDGQGVYLIYAPRGMVAHVGRTLRGQKGLRQRLKNHLAGRSSFTKKYLRGNAAALRDGYTFAFLEVFGRPIASTPRSVRCRLPLPQARRFRRQACTVALGLHNVQGGATNRCVK